MSSSYSYEHLIDFNRLQDQYKKEYQHMIETLSTNSAFSQTFQAFPFNNLPFPPQVINKPLFSFSPEEVMNVTNKNIINALSETPSIHSEIKEDKITSQPWIPKKCKKPPFCIITERKLKPDAIFKKVNKAFYHWMIIRLNILAKNKFKFIKVSKDLIKTIKKHDVAKILKHTLFETLLKDEGSEKYKTHSINQTNLQRIDQLKDDSFADLKNFLNTPLYMIYEEFKLDKSVNIKGPTNYVNSYNYLKDTYLNVFYNDVEL